jgi:hypothetical protein
MTTFKPTMTPEEEAQWREQMEELETLGYPVRVPRYCVRCGVLLPSTNVTYCSMACVAPQSPPNPRAPAKAHGTAGGYSNWRCRCDPCRTAWREQGRKKRARMSGEL